MIEILKYYKRKKKIVFLIFFNILVLVLYYFLRKDKYNFLNYNLNENLAKLNITNVEFFDLKHSEPCKSEVKKNDNILILIPLKSFYSTLKLVFFNLMNLTYDHSLIDVGFIVSETSPDDESIVLLKNLALLMQNKTLYFFFNNEIKKKQRPNRYMNSYENFIFEENNREFAEIFKLNKIESYDDFVKPFKSINIYLKNFNDHTKHDFETRHKYSNQSERRKILAKSRNWLLSTALKPYHSWVFWRDSDILYSPGTIIEDLMRQNVDIIVPNVWRKMPGFLNNEQPYDLNSWIESEFSLNLMKKLKEDDIIVEGYSELNTWRIHLAHLRNVERLKKKLIPLDGIGGVSILSKARVFRSGSNFPPFSFMNHIETEGFAKLSKKMKFSIFGLSDYIIWHLYEPDNSQLKQILKNNRKKNKILRKKKSKNL